MGSLSETGVWHPKGVTPNGCEIVTKVHANGHKRCLKFLIWLRKTYLTQINLKLEAVTSKEDSGERWWKKILDDKATCQNIYEDVNLSKGVNDMPFCVGKPTSCREQFGGAPRWCGRFRPSDDCGVQLPMSSNTIQTIRAQGDQRKKMEAYASQGDVYGLFPRMWHTSATPLKPSTFHGGLPRGQQSVSPH
jgi:hypothetical protein